MIRKCTVLAAVPALILALGSTAVAGDGHDHQKNDKMAAPKEASAKVVEIGKEVPNFALADLTGKRHKIEDLRGKIVVLEWFNPECPVVQRQHKEGVLKTYGNEVAQREDVVWLAVNSGGPGMQGNGMDLNKKTVKEWSLQYPLLVDESGMVGRMFQAKTTPHMFVIDKKGKLVYDGAIDNAPRGTPEGELVNYVEQALMAVAAGKPVETAKTKPYGCSVKYAELDG